VNSFRRVVRSGVREALDFGEVAVRGAVAAFVVVSVEWVRRTTGRVLWCRESWGGRNQPVVEFVHKAWPVGPVPTWHRALVIGGGGMYGNQPGGMVGSCRREGRCVPRAKGGKDMLVGKRQVDGTRSVGSSQGKPGVNA